MAPAPGILTGTIVKCQTDRQAGIAYVQIQIGENVGQMYQAHFGMNPGENNWNLVGTSIKFIPGADGRTSGTPIAFVVSRSGPAGQQYGS